MDVAKILVLLTLVIYAMGLLRACSSREGARVHPQPRPSAKPLHGGRLGAVTPFCSCSSIPLFIGFVEAGIPLGVTLSFLIASPMINEVAVVVAGVGHRLEIHRAVRRFRTFRGADRRLRAGTLQAGALVEDYVWKIHMGEVAQVEEDFAARPP